MKKTLLLAPAFLLGACAAAPDVSPPPIVPVPAAVKTQACLRGAIDTVRSFVLCPADAASADDVRQTFKGPADLSLNIASVAEEYGVMRQSIAGIEAATYVRIVGKRQEIPDGDAMPQRTASESANEIDIDDRTFRKVELKADNKKPAVLFIES